MGSVLCSEAVLVHLCSFGVVVHPGMKVLLFALGPLCKALVLQCDHRMKHPLVLVCPKPPSALLGA